jgi:hypothetical protein
MDWLIDITIRSPFWWGSLYGIGFTVIVQSVWRWHGQRRTEARLSEDTEKQAMRHPPPPKWVQEHWAKARANGDPSSANRRSPGDASGHSP